MKCNGCDKDISDLEYVNLRGLCIEHYLEYVKTAPTHELQEMAERLRRVMEVLTERWGKALGTDRP